MGIIMLIRMMKEKKYMLKIALIINFKKTQIKIIFQMAFIKSSQPIL